MSTRVTRSSSKRGSATLAADASSSSPAPAASSSDAEPSTPQKGKGKGKKATKQSEETKEAPRSSLSTGSPSPRSGKRVKLAVSDESDSAMNGGDAEEKAVKQQTFAEFLKGRTVAEVLSAGKNIVIVASNEPLVSAFQTLVSHHILSAPVWDPVKKQYLGFLDMRDLIRYVVEAVERRSIDQKALPHTHEDGCCGSSSSSSDSTEKKKKKAGKAGALEVVTDDSAVGDDSEELKGPLTPAAQHHHISAVLEHHSISVQDFIAKSKWAYVRPGDSLVSVLQQFSAGSHRVAVVNEQDKVIDVLSQSAVIKFIHSHRAELAQELAVHIDSIDLGTAPVLTVSETTSALDTFKVMAEKDRSGIAVVDADGRFVGNTSGSDLKLFVRCPEHMTHIRQPVMDFLAQVRQADVKETPNSRSPTISVPHNIALERVIGKLVVTRIHRLFVADSDKGYKPERVISITDVLRYILSRV